MPLLSTVVMAQLVVLETWILQMENRMHNYKVKMCRYMFTSMNFTEVCTKLYAPLVDNLLFSLDIHYFLTLCTGTEVSTVLGIFQFESASSKAGNHLLVETLVVSSFKLKLPSFLLQTHTQNMEVFKDYWELPIFNSFDVWDQYDGFRGARYTYN